MRLKSNARWMDLPGVECAYQSVGSPTAVDALLNVAHDHRSVGKYTATPGVLPPWSPEKGHTYNGTTQYLDTGVIPGSGFSMLARVSNGGEGFVAGSYNGGDTRFGLGVASTPASYSYGSNTAVISSKATCVRGVAAESGYLNGLLEYTPIGSWSGSAVSVYLGCRNRINFGGRDYYYTGNILAFLLASRTLTPAEVWLCSQQMKYCEVNPDWNAWGRRRRYYYAPLAAAIRWPGVGRGGPVGGSPGIRGSQ